MRSRRSRTAGSSRWGELQGRCVFPLHELYISGAILALIVAGLYFLIGAWGPVLLWGVATLFSNCFAGMPFIIYDEARARYRQGQIGAAGGYVLVALLSAALWLGLVGYCGYRAYQAIP